MRIDLAGELKKLGVERTADLTSLQIMGYDDRGEPIEYPDYAYGRSKSDRPFRWYDVAVPYSFPEFANAVSYTKGEIRRQPRDRAGYFFNVLGDWHNGRLTFAHTQRKKLTSRYSIYFDLLDASERPQQIPPRGWVGDGVPRCDEIGRTTMGADHCRVDLDDWDGDGLVDLIVGEHYGHVFWWPNLGTKQKPEFRYGKFVLADDGPIDAGMAAAPKVVDWDGDGNKDLIVGTHWNWMLYYRNVGDNLNRKLKFMGPIQVDGEPLQLPIAPLTRGSESVFRRDYYPVLECVDWDDDGDLDLLAGGYVTGSVFFYENTRPRADGTPNLILRGPLSADERRLNVGHWCAAPCAVDLDDDGDLDLLSGSMPMHLAADEQGKYEKSFLMYYENFGTHQAPALRATKFPGIGDFPRERLATPRTFDWDDDGDLDLVVSARENIYFFENIGTRAAPSFQLHHDPLLVPWGLSPIAVDQFRDWDGDGRLDLVRGYSVRLNSGVGNPYRWEKRVAVLPAGQYIAHPSGVGDDWFWPHLKDLDNDGNVDVLFGDWFGHVWMHRNLTDAKRKSFDVEGYRLQLSDGELIKVGPIGKDIKKDFDALQGARTVLTAADFDRDGHQDLVVGDTYGKIRFFRQEPAKLAGDGRHRFAQPVEIGNLGIRGLVDSTDWNDDGWPDVIASAANGKVRVFLNTKSSGPDARFAEGFDPKLPPIEQPRVLMADINGDGDKDLFLPSTQGSCFIERSFLKHGYAQAKLLALQRKP